MQSEQCFLEEKGVTQLVNFVGQVREGLRLIIEFSNMEGADDPHTSERKNFSHQTNLCLITRAKLSFRRFVLKSYSSVPQKF